MFLLCYYSLQKLRATDIFIVLEYLRKIRLCLGSEKYYFESDSDDSWTEEDEQGFDERLGLGGVERE